jgi:hypothetical protein
MRKALFMRAAVAMALLSGFAAIGADYVWGGS